MTQPTEKNKPTTIQRDVNVKDGDFVGRDKHIHLGPLKIPKYLLWGILATIVIPLTTIMFFMAFDIGIISWPTPLSVQPAAENETLILITNFYLAEGIDDSEAHRQIAQAIDQQIQANSLENIRVDIDPNITLRKDEQEHAREIAERYNASIIIWGDETSVEFTVNFLNLRQPTFTAADVTIKADSTSVHKAALANPEPYIQFVTEDLPVQLSFLSLFAVGQAEYNQGNYTHAVAIIEQAVQPVKGKKTNGLSTAYFRLGWLYQSPLEQSEEAIAYYDQAIDLDNEYAFAYTNRGIAYSDLDDYEQAIQNYDKAIDLDNEYAAAYNNRGSAYYDLGDYDKAIDLDNDFAFAYNGICWVHGLWQEPEKALPYCEEAVSRASTSSKPSYRDSRGLVYALLGEMDKAIEDFQFYVEAFAENPIKALSVAKRKAWIESLQAGENPFTPEVLGWNELVLLFAVVGEYNSGLRLERMGMVAKWQSCKVQSAS